jgi:meso-butanediol dehydrogenase / (S,S)-butanediol dehydrogenase / diacetyl reductase
VGKLSGQVALITGGGRGIGRAIALAYAREGASTVITDLDPNTASAVAGEAAALGVKAEAFAVDVREPQQSADMVARVAQRFGRLDILVNNAGVIRVNALLEVKPEDWDFIHDVNARGFFFVLQAAARQMVKQDPLGKDRPRGKIVNIASIAGRMGRPMLAAYCASKAAAISITQAAAGGLAPDVTVNAICPGAVETDMWKLIDREWTEIEQRPLGSAWQDRVAGVPMRRAQQPQDLTGMAVFLASADSDFITGQSYHVDGGMIMN